MTWSVGIYETEAAAKSAAARLSRAGFRGRKILYASRVAGQEEAAVQTLAEDAGLQIDQVKGYVRVLQEGKSMVVVQTPSDRAPKAIEILKRTAMTMPETSGPAERGETSGPAKGGKAAEHPRDDPAPFSRMIGMQPLAKSAPLADIELSSDPAPFSSRLGQAVLRKSAPINEIELKNDPSPMATRFGWKPLGKSGPMADIQLSSDPAPLSSRMGIDVLQAPPKRPWHSSFGMSLLINNPAPLSSLLGLPLLSKKDS